MPTNTTNIPTIEALKNLLQRGEVGTQADIKQALAKQGIVVNQSKISRLLRKVGAIKMVNEHGEAIYSLAREPLPPSSDSPLAQLILNISANEVMIVIRTNPGSASLIAHLLDRQYQELQILGTVAGDDTVFVVPQSTQSIPEVMVGIRELLGTR